MDSFGKKLYKSLDTASVKLTKGLEAVSALLIFICFLTLLFQVFYRFVIVKFFSFSFPFTEELARFLLIWTIYLIAGVNLREGSMVSINYIYDRLGIKGRSIMYYISRALIIIFLSLVFLYSLNVIMQNVQFRSSTLRAPGWLLFSAPAVGIVLLSYETVVEIIGVIVGEIVPFESRPSL